MIIAYDPDWRQLSTQQVKLVKNWSDQGGGLILVGGYINTVELIRPQEGEPDRYKPILDLLPVVLDDRRDYIERKADEPWALNLDEATPEMEFLKLDEELDETKFREDWKDFFYGEGKERSDKPIRGFYGFYPVEKAKVGSLVPARYTDPAAKLKKDGTLHPYLVTNPETRPRAVWIGSAESWRLREYKEAFHERFWTKLVRYAAAKSKGTASKPIRLEVGRVFPALRYVDVEAKIDGPGGEPLARGAKPAISIKMPPGVSSKEINRGNPILMSARPGAKDGWFSGRFQVRTPGEYELTVKVPRENVPGLESDLVETAKFTVKESDPELDNTKPDFDLMYRLASDAEDVLRRMKAKDADQLRVKLVRPKLVGTVAEGKEKLGEISLDKPRLYFTLENASLIPNCMVTDKQTSTSRGAHRDLWDEAIPLTLFWWVIVVAVLIAKVGGIWLLVLAFQESVGWGLACLFVPIVGLYYVATRWEKCWKVFVSFVVASLVVCATGFVLLVVRPELADQRSPVSLVLGAVVGLLSVEWLTRKLLRLA